MDEATWQACNDSTRMLEFLRATGGASDRKLRLFVCGCCRRVDGLHGWPEGRLGVETAERFADGLASAAELSLAEEKTFSASERAFWDSLQPPFYRPWEKQGRPRKKTLAEMSAAMLSYLSATRDIPDALNRVTGSEGYRAACPPAVAAGILRDLFGPLSRPPDIPSAVVSWNEATVFKLAQSIYDEWAFDRMPVLADALEEADCGNQDILLHLRQQGAVHVRGCFALDLLLNKG
jgi:hypothetical protein